MQETYLGALWRFATRGFVLKNDTMQIVLASLVPASYLWAGKPMPEGTASQVLAYIGMAAASFVAIRFIVAPYFVWKEQNQKTSDLLRQLNAPEFHSKSIARQHLDEQRRRLADALLGSIANAKAIRTDNVSSDFMRNSLSRFANIEILLSPDRKFALLWHSFEVSREAFLANISDDESAEKCWSSMKAIIAYLTYQD